MTEKYVSAEQKIVNKFKLLVTIISSNKTISVTL